MTLAPGRPAGSPLPRNVSSNPAASSTNLAGADTVEDWARAYISTPRLRDKCAPPPPPRRWAQAPPVCDLRPARPPELQVTTARPRSIKPGGLARVEVRAELCHKFWHHELQAAELLAWALLRFPAEAPEFRRGLLCILLDEIRHMALYETYLAELGFRVGAFPVRDWFWERVTTVRSALGFVALLGMGLEGANLEHTTRFAAWFRRVGDERGAEIQEQIGREEVAHVGFATRWFRAWTGRVDFDDFRAALPPPLTPLLLRGATIDRERRARAGMPTDFIDALAAFQP